MSIHKKQPNHRISNQDTVDIVNEYVAKEQINNSESVGSTERDFNHIRNSQIIKNVYKDPSDIKVSSKASLKADKVKNISSSVLGDRSKHLTKLPNISRQPKLEGSINSGAKPHGSYDDYYSSQNKLDSNRVSPHKIKNTRRSEKKVSLWTLTDN